VVRRDGGLMRGERSEQATISAEEVRRASNTAPQQPGLRRALSRPPLEYYDP